MQKRLLKVPLLLLGLFVSQMIFAQGASTLSQKIAKDFCDEFEKNKNKITKENMELEVGLLLLPLFSKYKNEIKEEWKLDASNQSDLGKIGQKIGQEAAINCQAFQNFVMNNINTIIDKRDNAKNSGKDLWVSGTIQKIEGQPFTYIYVKRGNGKLERLYWLEYFKGADKLSSSEKKYPGKNILFGYKEIEVYDITTKEYKTVKVITSFDDDPPPLQESLNN